MDRIPSVNKFKAKMNVLKKFIQSPGAEMTTLYIPISPFQRNRSDFIQFRHEYQAQGVKGMRHHQIFPDSVQAEINVSNHYLRVKNQIITGDLFVRIK
ncbi:MAG: hypothetical protein ACHQD7_08475 [Chitinophagales bacterium]